MAELSLNDVTVPVQSDPGTTLDNIGIVEPNTAPGSPVLAPTTEQTMNKAFTYGLPGIGVGLLDTLGQSIGVFKNSTVENTLKGVFGSGNGFADFYSQNKKALRAGGEIAGLAIPGMVALKTMKAVRYAREAGQLGSFLKDSASVDALLGNSATLTELEGNLTGAASDAIHSSGVFAGRTFATPDVAAAKRAYYSARLVDSVRNTAVFEGSYRALYNQSEVFFPSDYTISDQLKWGGLGLVGGAGIDYAMGRYAVRQLINKQAAKMATGAAADAFALSPQQKDIPNVVFRPNDRGPGITTFATMKNDLQNVIDTAGDPALKTNVKQDQTVIDNTIGKQLKGMASDPHVLIDRTELAPEQMQLGLAALKKNPTSFLFATKLGQLPEDQSEFYNGVQDLKALADKNLQVASLKVAALRQDNKADEAGKVLDKALAEYNQNLATSEEVHYVIEPDGRYSVYANRAPNWLDTNSMKGIKRQTYEVKTAGPPVDGKQATAKRSKLSVTNIDTPFDLHDNFRLELPRTEAPIAEFRDQFDDIQNSLTQPKEGYTRLFRGNRPGEIGKNPSFTSDAPGIAMPFQKAYGGNLSYVDVPTTDLTKYRAGAGATDAEYHVPSDLAAQAQKINFTPKIPPPKLNQQGYSALYAAASKMINEWDPARASGQRFILNENIPWRQTEMTLALADRHPEAAKLIDYTGQFSSAKDAMFHVADQKFQEFNKLMDMVERPPVTFGGKALKKTQITPAQVFQRLNMPEPIGMQAHPMTQVYAAGRFEGQSSLRDMFVNDKSLVQTDHPLDLFTRAMKDTSDGEFPPKALTTVGPLLLQNDTKPIFVAARSIPSLSISDENLHAMIENRRDLQLARLGEIDPKAAPLVSGVTSHIAGMPAASVARQVQTLHDGVVSGRGIVVPQDRINEQIPALKSAQLIAQDSDKFIDNHVIGLTNPTLTPLVGQMLKPQNKDKLFDFNRVEQAYRHGWDIKKTEPAPNGGVRFVLNEDSPINEKLKAQYFGSHEVDEESGGYMPDMSIAGLRSGYTPLTVSPAAGSLAQEISRISRQSGIENNALRVALGKSPITIRDFHLPTPELFKDDTYFIRNSAGDVVATYTGNAPSENKRRAIEDAGKLSKATGESHVAVPVSDVRLEHQVFDDNFFRVVNYADQLAKSGFGIRGGLAQATIDTGPETLKAMIKSLHQQFLNVGIRSRAAIFEPELNYAKNAAQVAGRDVTGDANIFDRYAAIMFSRAVQPGNSAFGKLYGSIENYGDKTLSWLYAHYAERNAYAQLGAKIPEAESGNFVHVTKGPKGEVNIRSQYTAPGAEARGLKQYIGRVSSDDEMKGFKNELSDWSPFKTTQDWLDSTYRQVTPPSVRSSLAKLSLVSSTMSLRFLDAGTAVNNLLGVMTAAPAVVYGMRRLPGEAHEDWINRTAAWGTQLHDGIMTFSPMKAMANAAKGYWRGDFNEAMADAASKGYFEPEYAALAKVLTEPVRGGKGSVAKWADYASKLADSSETLSRKMSWAVGYSIGKDLHKFEDKRSLYMFAQNFVNDTIGNYSPKNKPAMFQGAVGLPLGAFQTWMFNFYRRMYGYVERGDIKSLAAQYATQQALFGARSVPGWNAWNSAMFQSEGTGDTQESRVERSFPPGVRELLLNGSLSGIPAIFGYDSPAFYTRGSVDFTQAPPTLLSASKAPPIQFLAETYNGIKATIDNIFGAGGFSVQQQEEILANFTTNRALKSIMELAAGSKTDSRGQKIDYGTRDAVHIASALAGSTPSSVRNLQRSYLNQQTVELSQADLRAKLNDKTRALIRGGEFDVSDFQDVAQAYLHSGGNPAYLGEWLRNTDATANTPKAIAKMGELGRSGRWLEFLDMLATIQHQQPQQ